MYTELYTQVHSCIQMNLHVYGIRTHISRRANVSKHTYVFQEQNYWYDCTLAAGDMEAELQEELSQLVHQMHSVQQSAGLSRIAQVEAMDELLDVSVLDLPRFCLHCFTSAQTGQSDLVAW